MYKSLIINSELKIQLELLAYIEPEFVTNLIMALLWAINGEQPDPDDMPTPVKNCFIYWMNGNLASIIKVE